MIYLTKVNKRLCFQLNCLVGTKPSGLSHCDGPTFEQGAQGGGDGPEALRSHLHLKEVGVLSETGIPALQGMAG